MKKRILATIFLGLAILAFASCKAQSETSDSTSETQPEITSYIETEYDTVAITTSKPLESMTNEERRETYLDRQRTYKPTPDDLASIDSGMPLSEIIDRIGKPHSIGPNISIAVLLVWEMSDGAVCAIYVVPSNDIEKPTYWDFFEHGVAAFTPKVSNDLEALEYLK